MFLNLLKRLEKPTIIIYKTVDIGLKCPFYSYSKKILNVNVSFDKWKIKSEKKTIPVPANTGPRIQWK